MISHSKRFIFVRIQKTAGGSIKSALSGQCRFKNPFHQHILDMLEEAKPNKNYFKFCFVRNPWDRTVSRYFYNRKNSYKAENKERLKRYRNSTFEEFVLNKNDKFARHGYIRNSCKISCKHLIKMMAKQFPYDNQLDWITDENGKILVDFIGQFETLRRDFKMVCRRIGIRDALLPHKNKTNHKHYTKYYNDETRRIIAEKFHKDIEYFGYKFE